MNFPQLTGEACHLCDKQFKICCTKKVVVLMNAFNASCGKQKSIAAEKSKPVYIFQNEWSTQSTEIFNALHGTC